MNTNLGAEALNNLNRFKNLCTDEEFQFLENAVIEMDNHLQGKSLNSIQAKYKLTEIKNLEFSGFTSVMYEYFGKTPSQYLNQAI